MTRNILGNEEIKLAYDFAKDAHQGQVRKVSGKNVFFHMEDAYDIVFDMTLPERWNPLVRPMGYPLDVILWNNTAVLKAVLLHDTVEDTKVTLADITAQFDSLTTHYVSIMTEDKSKPWKERKQHTICFHREARDPWVKLIKFADVLSNVRSCKEDYENVGDVFFKTLKPRSFTEYWFELIDTFSIFKEFDEYKELLELKAYFAEIILAYQKK